MSAFERFMMLIGDRRVMKALGWTVLTFAVALIIIMADSEFPVTGEVVLLTVLCGLPLILVLDYLKGRPGNLIQTIEEVAEETEHLNEDDAHAPEDRRIYSWSEPVPMLNVLDPTTPDPPLVKALGPATLLNWPKGEAERKDDS